MKNIYGITGIRIKVIEAAHEVVSEINDFLAEYDGNIIDIQVVGMAYGMCKYIITYKAFEE